MSDAEYQATRSKLRRSSRDERVGNEAHLVDVRSLGPTAAMTYLQRAAGNFAVNQMLLREGRRTDPGAAEVPSRFGLGGLLAPIRGLVVGPNSPNLTGADGPTSTGTSVVARQGTAPARLSAKDRDKGFQDALAAHDYKKAAQLLIGFGDAEIVDRVNKIGEGDLDPLRQANEEVNNQSPRIRAPILDRLYNIARGKSDWATASVILNGFDQRGIEERVKALSAGDRVAMLAAVPGWTFRVRSVLLDACFLDAKAAGDWGKAAEYYNGFNQIDLEQRIGALSADDQKQLEAGARRAGSLDRIIDVVRQKNPSEKAGGIFGKTDLTQSPGSGGHVYWCKTNIVFHPDPKVANASEIAFVQTIKVVKTTGGGKSEDEREGIKGRLNSQQQAVDRAPKKDSGWYGFENSGNAGSMVSPGKSPNPLKDATMEDTPDHKEPGLTFEFETAVIAKAGPDAGLVYAVIHWGFQADDNRKVTLLPSKVEDRASAGFGSAVGAWNKQAASSDKSSANQQQLPPSR